MKIPHQYLPIMPYLVLQDSKGFLEFAKTVFAAKEQLIVPSDDKDEIRHGEIRIFDAVVMFGNASENWSEKPGAMFMYVENAANIYQIAMAHQSKSLEKPAQKDYGYSASFEDPYGNHWFITEAEK